MSALALALLLLVAPSDARTGTTGASAPPAAGATATATLAAALTPAPSDRPPVEVRAALGAGVTVDAGEAFSLNVKARAQLRYQLGVGAPDERGERDLTQSVSVGTARVWLSGRLLRPELTYLVQLAIAGRDFRDGATSPIYDAYFDLELHRDFNVRAGQFFVPHDRLRTVREWGLQMADRPRPVAELTLDRDIGLMAYSERFLGDASPVAIRLGVFGGGGINAGGADPPSALLVGRLELRPLGPIDDDQEGDLARRERPGLAIGAGVSAALGSRRLRVTTGPRFAGGAVDQLHGALDLVFKWRGFALEAEGLVRVAAEDAIVSTAADGSPRREPTRSGLGVVAQASYVFDPPIELVLRWSRLTPLGDTDPTWIAELDGRGTELAAGLNYYFRGHQLKLQLDWVARLAPDFGTTDLEHVAHAQLDVTL